MHFWLAKGVDGEGVVSLLHFSCQLNPHHIGDSQTGFRQDVINMVSKVSGLPDAKVTDPTQFLQPDYSMFTDGPVSEINPGCYMMRR